MRIRWEQVEPLSFCIILPRILDLSNLGVLDPAPRHVLYPLRLREALSDRHYKLNFGFEIIHPGAPAHCYYALDF